MAASGKLQRTFWLSYPYRIQSDTHLRTHCCVHSNLVSPDTVSHIDLWNHQQKMDCCRLVSKILSNPGQNRYLDSLANRFYFLYRKSKVKDNLQHTVDTCPACTLKDCSGSLRHNHKLNYLWSKDRDKTVHTFFQQYTWNTMDLWYMHFCICGPQGLQITPQNKFEHRVSKSLAQNTLQGKELYTSYLQGFRSAPPDIPLKFQLV